MCSMKKTFLILYVFTVGGLLISPTNDVEAQEKQARFIDVTLEIHGLEESIQSLREASDELSNKLLSISQQQGDYDADDLARIESIAASMQSVAEQIDQTINGVGSNLLEAKQPAVELVSAVVQEARAKGVDPLIASLNDSVDEAVSQVKWSLIWVGFVVLIGLGLFGYFMFKSLTELNGLTTTFREAFQKGEFTYRLNQDAE